MKRLIKKAEINTFYHGTSMKNALDILQAGYLDLCDPNNSPNEAIQSCVYLTKDFDLAKRFAEGYTSMSSAESADKLPVIFRLSFDPKEMADTLTPDDLAAELPEKVQYLLDIGINTTKSGKKITQKMIDNFGDNMAEEWAMQSLVGENSEKIKEWILKEFTYEDSLNGWFEAVGYNKPISISDIDDLIAFDFEDFDVSLNANYDDLKRFYDEEKEKM